MYIRTSYVCTKHVYVHTYVHRYVCIYRKWDSVEHVAQAKTYGHDSHNIKGTNQLLKGCNSEPQHQQHKYTLQHGNTCTPASSLATTAPRWSQTCPAQRRNWSRRATTLSHLQDSLCCRSSVQREQMSWTPSYTRTYVRLYLRNYLCMYICTKWTLPSDSSVHADTMSMSAHRVPSIQPPLCRL